MAEGIARSLAPAGVRVCSAGSAPARLDPMAVRVLAEIGLDISDQFAKNLDEAPIGDVDTVITLCANEVCPASLGQVPLLKWSLPDPADPGASESTQLRAFREVRDELRRRLAVAFGKVS
jgi:arsenate reductase